MNKKNTVYGGQALIEGVMIRGPAYYAIAVRRQNSSIFIQSKKVSDFFQKFSTKFPIIRGIIVLIDMLITGFSALNRSAQIALEDTTNIYFSFFRYRFRIWNHIIFNNSFRSFKITQIYIRQSNFHTSYGRSN